MLGGALGGFDQTGGSTDSVLVHMVLERVSFTDCSAESGTGGAFQPISCAVEMRHVIFDGCTAGASAAARPRAHGIPRDRVCMLRRTRAAERQSRIGLAR